MAGGFLVSTVVGTFYPLFGKFARSQGVDRGAVGWFCRVWLRALMAVGVGYVAARWVQGIGLHGPMTLLGAAAAAGAGLLVVLAWVGGRSLRKTGSWKVRVWESL